MSFSVLCYNKPSVIADSAPVPNGIPVLDNEGGLSVNAATVTEIMNSGGTFNPKRTITTNATAADTDRIIRVDTTAGNVLLTLPPAATVAGQEIVVKRITAGANTLTIQADGTENIDAANTNTSLSSQWSHVTLYSNGAGWDIIG